MTTPGTDVDERFEQGVALIEAALADSSPELLTGPEALFLTDLMAKGERLCSSGIARFGAQVVSIGAHHGNGHRDGASWLGTVTGESKGRAASLLSTVEALAVEPSAAEAFERGELSVPQAEVVAKVAPLGQEVVDELLSMARDNQSLVALRTHSKRMAARHQSEEDAAARDARQYAQRYLNTWRGEDGGLHGRFFLPDKDAARFLARLEFGAQHLFKTARREDLPGKYETWRADALLTLVTGAERTKDDGRDVHVLVRVDAAALKRGTVQGDECCEIDGLGPVSVATVRSLMDDSIFAVTVADSVDIYAVSRPHRRTTARQRTALVARDPECVIPGCTIPYALDIHHWQVPVIEGGKAELSNLCRACKVHHYMMTKLGCRLEGGPGKWVFIDPRKDGGGGGVQVSDRMKR